MALLVAERHQTCSDPGPNGPASLSHQHGQTVLILVHVGLLAKAPKQLKAKNIVFMRRLTTLACGAS